MFAIGLLHFTRMFGQDPGVAEAIAGELMEKGQTEEAEELYATVAKYIDQPVDLNSCSKEELSGTGIFTAFQVFAIMDQRERYGPFLSIYELVVIPGINRDFLDKIREMICFAPTKQSPGSPHMEGMMLTNTSYRFPVASGMHSNSSEQAAYQGDPLKLTQRVQLGYGDQFSFGAAFEKDPGETWANRQRPEHLTGYLLYQPGNRSGTQPWAFIEKIVIGNFRIHRGMGLVHQLGFNSRNTGYALNGYRRSYGKPFASTLEYDYFRGLYGAASAGKWELDVLLSYRPADLSFFRFAEKNDLFDMTRQTGLHRTMGERQGFDLARQLTSGAALNRSGKNFYAGCSFTGARMRLTENGMDSLKTTDPMHATRSTLSAYGVVFGSAFEIYGEAALDNAHHTATLLGGVLVINPALSLDASARRITPGYRKIMSGSSVNKEDVFTYHTGIRITPFNDARLRIYHDISIAAPRTFYAGPLVPEHYTSIECTYKKGNGPAITLRYTGKQLLESITNGHPGNGTYTNTRQQHFRIHYRWEPMDQLIFQGRLEISTLAESNLEGSPREIGSDDAQGAALMNWNTYAPGSDVGAVSGIKDRTNKKNGRVSIVEASPAIKDGTNRKNETGSMAWQQVQWTPRRGIRITYRYLLFNVEEWENRIYSYEPGVRYSFLFPAWYGKGSRNVLVVSAKISRRYTVRGKCGLTVYAHRWETGTGNDMRNGNRRFDLEVQLQADIF